jgi:hypothetical protein
MPCSVVVGYQCFRGPCCLYLQGEVSGNGKNMGLDIGLEHKRVAESASQREVERGQSGSQCYQCETPA